MLKIAYQDASGREETITYKSASEFIANQQLEVPDLEDYYKVNLATVDDQPIQLSDSTIYGLYNQLESTKNDR